MIRQGLGLWMVWFVLDMVRLVLVADCKILIVNLNNLENCGVGYVKTCVGNACTCVGYS